jgi:hypothetical protein
MIGLDIKLSLKDTNTKQNNYNLFFCNKESDDSLRIHPDQKDKIVPPNIKCGIGDPTKLIFFFTCISG